MLQKQFFFEQSILSAVRSRLMANWCKKIEYNAFLLTVLEKSIMSRHKNETDLYFGGNR